MREVLRAESRDVTTSPCLTPARAHTHMITHNTDNVCSCEPNLHPSFERGNLDRYINYLLSGRDEQSPVHTAESVAAVADLMIPKGARAC
jgi:hypothetical protein